jgi:GAF domain-containing protein
MKPPIPENDAKRVEALRRFDILDTQPEPIFDDVVHIASAICNTPIAVMSLVDSERQWFKARVGLDSSETPREQAFCAYTILGTEPLVVEDAKTDERFADNPFVTSAPHIRFYAGAPLIDRDGNALGSLCVVDQIPRKINVQQQRALKALARSVIAHLELRRVSCQLAQALNDLKTLRGLLPICSHCKNIRNDKGYWDSVESFVSAHSEAGFTHSICPNCIKKLYPDFYEELRSRNEAQPGGEPLQ